jgi:hypothetical protein
VILELLVANVIEPWLYGTHTGISSLAILVAAVFWAMLWGPVGLILSTPLTVCLILMGRYVPQLNFLEVMLGDEPVLPLEAHFYQRLLALDQDEARDIAETYLKEKPIGSFYDSVLVPVLTLAEQDRHLNLLEAGTTSFVSQNTRDLIDELGERSFDEKSLIFDCNTNGDELNKDKEGLSRIDAYRSALSCLRVVCIPASDEADELVAMMMAQLLSKLGCDVNTLPVAPRANLLNELATHTPQVAIVSALPPFAVGQARSLCKRLRQRQPDLKIFVGLWNFEGGVAKAQDRLGSGAADVVVTSLEAAISLLAATSQSISLSNETQSSGASHPVIVKPNREADTQHSLLP